MPNHTTTATQVSLRDMAYAVLAVTCFILCIPLMGLLIIKSMPLCGEIMMCHPWWTVLSLVLLCCIVGYVVMSQGKPACVPASEPPTDPARPFMSQTEQARRKAAMRAGVMPERKPDPGEWSCGRDDDYIYTPFGGRIRRSDATRTGRKTGHTSGSSNIGSFGHIDPLFPNSKPTPFSSTRVAGFPGQSTRRDLDAPRYGTNDRFGSSTLAPSSRSHPVFGNSAGCNTPGLAFSSGSRYLQAFNQDFAAKYSWRESTVPAPSPVPAPVPALFQAPAPILAPAPAPRFSIPVFAPAPAPMVVDEFKPRRPRSPVLPPTPTSTYVHGPRATAGQLIRTRLDFADMTLSLGRRDVDMRGPGMGDMDTDLPGPPRKTVGPGPMDVDRPRRARRNSDLEMTPPFVEEDVDMESAEMTMEWDAAVMAY